jgi:hypothetical protein
MQVLRQFDRVTPAHSALQLNCPVNIISPDPVNTY